MSEQKLFDVEKVLECHASIVNDIKRILLPDLHSVFNGANFVEWIVNNSNPTNLSREELSLHIQGELYSPFLHNQLIYSADEGGAFQDSIKQHYRFIEDQFKEYKKDRSILNLYGVDTSDMPFFYQRKEEYSILPLLDELKVVMEEIFTDFLDESKTLVDYIRLAELRNVTEKLVPVVAKLAYADLGKLTQSQNLMKAFFINVYNAMSIHAVVSYYQREKKLKISLVDRPNFYSKLKYNIGGHNYSLSDIEQGILRNNSTMANDMTSAVLDFTLGGRSKGERFGVNDPRRKYVLQYVDPRIHFALNSACVACPAYRFYTAEDLDSQLDLAAQIYCQTTVVLKEEKDTVALWIDEMFKFYKQDFAKNDYALVNYVLSYLKDEQRDHYLSKMEQKQFQLKFTNYNWDLNKRYDS